MSKELCLIELGERVLGEQYAEDIIDIDALLIHRVRGDAFRIDGYDTEA